MKYYTIRNFMMKKRRKKMKGTLTEVIKEVKKFSFGDTGTLRFFHKQFQKGYEQALNDVLSLEEKGYYTTLSKGIFEKEKEDGERRGNQAADE